MAHFGAFCHQNANQSMKKTAKTIFHAIPQDWAHTTKKN